MVLCGLNPLSFPFRIFGHVFPAPGRVVRHFSDALMPLISLPSSQTTIFRALPRHWLNLISAPKKHPSWAVFASPVRRPAGAKKPARAGRLWSSERKGC